MTRRKTTDADPDAPQRSAKQLRVDAVVAGLKSRHKGLVLESRDYTMPWAVRRLPFGIADLDIATAGGAPAGGMTMLVGKPGEGKNYILNRLIRNQQRIYGDDCAVGIIGTELPYDKGQARAAGVKVALSDDEIEALDTRNRKLRRGGLTPAEIAELRTEIGRVVVVPPSTAEESFDIAVEMVLSGEFNIVGLDSFGSVLTEGDDEKDMADGSPRVGGPAGLNTQLMRKLNNAFAPRNGKPNLTAFIGINQVRDKMNAKSNEKQTHESGGWMLKHGRFLTVELTRKAYVRDGDGGPKIAKMIGWEITKQKAGGWEGHAGEYKYVMADCAIDEGELALRMSLQYDLIEKEGNTYTYGGVKLGVGKDNAADALVKYGLVDELNEEIMQRAGVTLVT